jgi:hypothetical protein
LKFLTRLGNAGAVENAHDAIFEQVRAQREVKRVADRLRPRQRPFTQRPKR